MKLRMRKKKLNNFGVTLVELIATFTLLAVFMTCATLVIMRITNTYYEEKGFSYGMQVSDIITKHISSEIEGALTGVIVSDDYKNSTGKDSHGAVLIYDDENGNSVIEFQNKEGSRVRLGLEVNEDGTAYLVEHFYEIIANTSTENGGADVLYKAVDWKFDPAVYMGYYIEKLEFSLPPKDVYNENIICVQLEIKSPKYGSYHVVKYIECYNFNQAAEYSRIVYK